MDDHAVECYRRAGRIAGEARDLGASLLTEGTKLFDVATQVEDHIRKQGGDFAFPCCLSLNADAAHYSPSVNDQTVLKRGDVVKLDCGVQVDGYIGDTAVTVEVGSTDQQQLMDAARTALDNVIDMVRDGVAIQDIGAAIESTITSFGYRPVVNLTGHSVDRYHQHAGLSIPNVPTGRGNIDAPITVAIEPFATDGVGSVRDAGGGHIYHFQAPRPQRDAMARKVLAHIQQEHPDLPFSERWLQGVVPDARIPFVLRLLERSGAIKHYPILRETGKGMVAQFEHTFLVLPDEVVVTTRT